MKRFKCWGNKRRKYLFKILLNPRPFVLEHHLRDLLVIRMQCAIPCGRHLDIVRAWIRSWTASSATKKSDDVRAVWLWPIKHLLATAQWLVFHFKTIRQIQSISLSIQFWKLCSNYFKGKKIETQNMTFPAPTCPPHSEENLDLLISFSLYISCQLA